MWKHTRRRTHTARSSSSYLFPTCNNNVNNTKLIIQSEGCQRSLCSLTGRPNKNKSEFPQYIIQCLKVRKKQQRQEDRQLCASAVGISDHRRCLLYVFVCSVGEHDVTVRQVRATSPVISSYVTNAPKDKKETRSRVTVVGGAAILRVGVQWQVRPTFLNLGTQRTHHRN